MSDSEGEQAVSAKNLIKGYEKGEVYKSGEVKGTEKPEFNEPLAKKGINEFESGNVFNKQDIHQERPDIAEPVTKDLISSFEKGGMYKTGDVKSEKPVARPGAAKKLQKVYESLDDSATATPLSPTSKSTAKVVNGAVSGSANSGQKSEKKKTVLLVLAHWAKEGSFNGALHEVAEKTLKKMGCEVLVSDLYAMNWNPVISSKDVGDDTESIPKDTAAYLDEKKDAVVTGKISSDIAEEQAKVKAADLIIFQFPLAWLSFPAILKGWVDRVLCNGFSFIAEQGKLYDNGLLKGKKALLSITTGGGESVYSNTGVNGDIEVALWPLQYGALRFSGFDVLPPNLCYGVTMANDGKRKDYLKRWENRLTNVFKEEPLKFIPLEQFDLKRGLVLKDDSVALKEARKTDKGASIGQNLGKSFPAGSMLGSV